MVMQNTDYDFGKIVKITKTGRLRIQYLKKQYVYPKDNPNGIMVYQCPVRPVLDQLEGTTTLTDANGYKRKDNEQWERYDPTYNYTCYNDLDA